MDAIYSSGMQRLWRLISTHSDCNLGMRVTVASLEFRGAAQELLLEELYLPFRAKRFHICTGWLQRLSLTLELLTVQWLSVFSDTKRLLWFSFLSLRFELPCSGECGRTPDNACVLGVRMYYCCAEFKWHLSHHGCFSWRHKEHLSPKPSHPWSHAMLPEKRNKNDWQANTSSSFYVSVEDLENSCPESKVLFFKISFLPSKHVNRLTRIFSCHLVMIAILIKVKSSSDGRYAFGAVPTELTHRAERQGSGLSSLKLPLSLNDWNVNRQKLDSFCPNSQIGTVLQRNWKKKKKKQIREVPFHFQVSRAWPGSLQLMTCFSLK